MSGSVHSHGVLAIVVVSSSAGAGASVGLSTDLLLDDFERVLLGFLGGVGVVEVGLMAANDVTGVRHFDLGG
jgi:hypothetical protein